MLLKKMKNKSIAIFVAAAFALTVTPVMPVSAALIENDQVIGAERATDARATVDTFMARDDVRGQFERLGVDPAEADQRIAALSDAELVRLADEIETAPAGEGAAGAVIGAAVLIFVVLLITDILGFTHVFSFVTPAN